MFSVVIDCSDPEALAPFWMQATGYERGPWPHDPYVVLVAPDRRRPHLILQRVTEPKQGKNRLHIDLYARDIDAEAERLSKAGAVIGGKVEEHDARWIVMSDPEGNEFCVVEDQSLES